MSKPSLVTIKEDGKCLTSVMKEERCNKTKRSSSVVVFVGTYKESSLHTPANIYLSKVFRCVQKGICPNTRNYFMISSFADFKEISE